MEDETTNIRWAKAQIAEQDKIIAEAEATKADAVAKKADLQAYIRIEQAKEGMWVDHPVIGALNAAAEVFDASRRGAKKRGILLTLSQADVPIGTAHIVTRLNEMGLGATVDNTSPQLSTFKSEGLTDLMADGWVITKKGREYLAEKN